MAELILAWMFLTFEFAVVPNHGRTIAASKLWNGTGYLQAKGLGEHLVNDSGSTIRPSLDVSVGPKLLEARAPNHGKSNLHSDLILDSVTM